MNCRHCQRTLSLELIDLGSSPPSNAYLTEAALKLPERWFPLRVLVCEGCWLAQTEDFSGLDQLFDADYAYFSSFSTSWLEHSRKYVNDMKARFNLDSSSLVVEVAANDGYLLQFVEAENIPCFGVEPTASTASSARAKGIEIVQEFFGTECASRLVSQGKRVDLAVANNVLAHVPQINDFVAGFTQLLQPQGVATFEFPHLLRLMQQTQFDTIYHEHFSYLSLTCVQRILASEGLTVFDVEELSTHGGSLRVYAQATATGGNAVYPTVATILESERREGLQSSAFYSDFQRKSERVKNELIEFLLSTKKDGKTVAAYGAAAKGNTLLNFAGIRKDLIPFVVDRNPAKQGKYLPGSRIPVVEEAQLSELKPDFVLILPWNLTDEVVQQLSYIKEWKGRFVTAVPELRIIA